MTIEIVENDPINMVIFHGYVSLPGGIYCHESRINLLPDTFVTCNSEDQQTCLHFCWLQICHYLYLFMYAVYKEWHTYFIVHVVCEHDCVIATARNCTACSDIVQDNICQKTYSIIYSYHSLPSRLAICPSTKKAWHYITHTNQQYNTKHSSRVSAAANSNYCRRAKKLTWLATKQHDSEGVCHDYALCRGDVESNYPIVMSICLTSHSIRILKLEHLEYITCNTRKVVFVLFTRTSGQIIVIQ